MNGRVVGVGGSTLALLGMVTVALGLFTSLFGTLIAGVIAAVVGVSAGAIMEPRRTARTAVVVTLYVACLVFGYLALTQYVARHSPPGSSGGANTLPPQ